MCDTISRKAAIEKFEYTGELTKEQVIYLLSCVPSCEPKIIPCEKCFYWEKVRGQVLGTSIKGWCDFLNRYMVPDGFCSFGKYKE